MTNTPAPAPARKPFPRPVQSVVIVLCGFAMMFFGCLGALATVENVPAVGWTLAALAMVGALAFLFGVLLVLVLFVQGVIKAFKGTPPPAAPPDSTGGQ